MITDSPVDSCPVCEMPAKRKLAHNEDYNQFYNFECPRCGEFCVGTEVLAPDGRVSIHPAQTPNVSGFLRENPSYLIASHKVVETLNSIPTPAVAEKARKLLFYLARKYPSPGTEWHPRLRHLDSLLKKFKDAVAVGHSQPILAAARDVPTEEFQWIGACWASGSAELRFLLFDCLRDATGFLRGEQETRKTSGATTPITIAISAKGWLEIQSTGLSDKHTGFVAMWFSPEMDEVWTKAIEPAIRAAGYLPLRIDKHHHNNKIDDEIIASIRGAKFLVADFTGQRGGVYYEAGFAAGLGKPVIWTVRNDHLPDVHFDTRQYNHIVWEHDNLTAFQEALTNRIRATLEQGPASSEANA